MNVDRNDMLVGANTNKQAKLYSKGSKIKKYQRQIKMADRETADHTSIHKSTFVPIEE